MRGQKSDVATAQEVAPSATREWVMPKPAAIVVWRNCPDGEWTYAIVTKVGRSSINLILFPPDSRAGHPKDGVRFAGDPWNRSHGVNSESGIWDFTEESKALRRLIDASDEPLFDD